MTPPRRVLVIVTRRIGDVLLATPVIRSLKHAWPDAAIDAVVAERADDVRHDRDGARAFDTLTAAQLEVLTLMAQGFDNDAIATRRGCSVSSVGNLIAELYRRLGINPRGELNPRVEAVRQFAQASGLPDRPA